MDLKGITWVGNIYQKFETLCLEVEEIMYQDTVDLLENHVQTVGASVKKFYSDVVQKKDISGIDLQDYKKEDVEIVKKPKIGRKFAERKNVTRNVENVLPMATRITPTSNNDGNLVNQTSEICELSLREPRMENQVEITEDDAIRSGAENETRCEQVMADPSSQDLLHMGNNTFFFAERPIGAEDNDNGREEIDFFNPAGEVEDSYMICTDSTSCLFEQKETTFTESNLEESCIFVDDDELEFLTQVDKGKHKHHKKTLREAFSPRKRSSRAQEYKQLAAKYSDEAQSSKDRAQSSRLEEGGESEWEIL